MHDADLGQMNSMQFDVLKEIGNIGAGNATTALSQMLSARVDMKVPKVDFLEFKDMGGLIGGEENIVVGILLMLQEDVDGMMMFLLEKESAKNIVQMLMGAYVEVNHGDDFNEMELSALQEIGNIITGAYLSSLSSLTNLTITASVPYMAIDMAGAILSVPAIEFGKISDKALMIETEFGEAGNEVNGFFILIPTLESYDRILTSLGF